MILETERLYLRRFVLSDAATMSEYRSTEAVSKYQSWNHYTLADAQKRINECLQVEDYNKVGTNYHLAIILKEQNSLIGDLFIEVMNRRVFVLGYTLNESYWHLGIASEMVKAFCAFMKQEYHFKKVVCYVYVDNISSKKLLKRNGFIKFEESYYYDDEGYIKKL